MFKSVFKIIIIFFISFLFINNIYAENLIVTYRYKTVGTDYIVTYDINPDLSYAGNVTVSKYSSISTGVAEPIESKRLEDLLPTDLIFINYGLTGAVSSFDNYYTYFMLNDDDFIADLKKNPEKYRPILKFDENGDPILIGSYFYSEAFEETKDASINLNDYANEIVENFLSGRLNPIPGTGILNCNLYEMLNLDDSLKVDFYGANVDYINSNDDSSNTNFTVGTCEKYYKVLKEMREVITGKTLNGKKIDGVCSAKSLNAMQNVSSLYDLENNFDNSLLEPTCKNMIFSDNGYIKKIIEAQTFYNNLSFKDEKNAQMITCLGMESEYLKGFSLLTTYMPVTENIDKNGCEIISSKVIDFINEMFDAVKIICTAVCIILCIMDIYKIVVTKENDVTKFKTVLIKRVIALVAVFLLPLFINIITDLINERYLKSNPSNCSNIIRK